MKKHKIKISIGNFWLSAVSLMLLVFAGIILTSTKYTGYDKPASIFIGNIRILFISINILLLLAVLLISFKSIKNEVFKKALLAFVSIFIILSILEIVFMNVAVTNGKADNLASRIWFKKYWRVNSLNYRDTEPNVNADKNKYKIMLVGDSYVAGHGIKEPADRFGDILQKKLSGNQKIFNLGHNGWDTEAEFNAITKYPLQPDLIILCHCPNDIERCNGQSSLLKSVPYNNYNKFSSLFPNGFFNYLIDNSYLLNFFYYKFYVDKRGSDNFVMDEKNALSSMKDGNYYGKYLTSAIMTQHLNQLGKFIIVSKQYNIRLVVVLFPETYDNGIDFSEKYVNYPLFSFFKNNGVPVIDTYQIFKNIPEKDRIVNKTDAHPSELANKRIAEELYNFLKSTNYVQ